MTISQHNANQTITELSFRSGTDRLALMEVRESYSIDDLLDMAMQRHVVTQYPFVYEYPAVTALNQLTFYEHDHLGNLRVAFTPVVDCNSPTGLEPDPLLSHPNSSFTLEQVVDYYPYNAILRQYVNAGGPERYLSTQHERDQETGLDYRGARYYDSDVARFLSLDPLGGHEVQVDKSPYMYVWGNPVSNTDPDGRCPWCPDLMKRASISMAGNVNGWGAYTLGFSQGIVNHAQGTWNAITHPVQTAKTMMAMQQPGSSESIQAAMGMAMSANALVNGNGFERGQVIGGAAATLVEGAALTKGAGAMMRGAEAATISNPVPNYVSRVVPGAGPHPTIGAPGAVDAFVTAADDIAGMNAQQIQKALAIDPSSNGYTTYTFSTPEGIASPVFRDYPKFIGGGRTAGGAREFVVPNGPFPQGTTSTYTSW